MDRTLVSHDLGPVCPDFHVEVWGLVSSSARRFYRRTLRDRRYARTDRSHGRRVCFPREQCSMAGTAPSFVPRRSTASTRAHPRTGSMLWLCTASHPDRSDQHRFRTGNVDIGVAIARSSIIFPFHSMRIWRARQGGSIGMGTRSRAAWHQAWNPKVLRRSQSGSI